MEPLDCAIRLEGRPSAISGPDRRSRLSIRARRLRILGLPPTQVNVHTQLAGGSFGRRATPNADMVSEAAFVVKAIGGRAPVKVVWTREDDIRGGRYRPMYFHTLKAGLDAEGDTSSAGSIVSLASRS